MFFCTGNPLVGSTSLVSTATQWTLCEIIFMAGNPHFKGSGGPISSLLFWSLPDDSFYQKIDFPQRFCISKFSSYPWQTQNRREHGMWLQCTRKYVWCLNQTVVHEFITSSEIDFLHGVLCVSIPMRKPQSTPTQVNANAKRRKSSSKKKNGVCTVRPTHALFNCFWMAVTWGVLWCTCC